MKRYLLIIIILLTITNVDTYSYKVKESSTARFKIENFKEEIKKLDINFDEFGKKKEYGILGYYNFYPLIKNKVIIAYACLTHLKVYDRHEPFIVLLSLDNKIIDYSIPEARKKHKILNSEEVKNKVKGKGKGEKKYLDGIAGSTFHIPAINAELENILNMFEYRKEIIRKDEIQS